MDTIRIKEMIKQLAQLNYQNMYLDDFLLTWEKSNDMVPLSPDWKLPILRLLETPI